VIAAGKTRGGPSPPRPPMGGEEPEY